MPINILNAKTYRGPNVWSRVPSIHLTVDIGELEDRPTNKIPDFTDKLVALMPSLHDHYCSVGRPGGFIERMHDGTWMGHVLEHVALELQNLGGADVGRGLSRETGQRGVYDVIYQYEQPDVGMASGRLANRLLNWLIYDDDPEFEFTSQLEQLILLAERLAYGPSTKALVDEAERRNIPVLRLDPRRSLVQLGHGRYQRRLWATTTSSTSNIAVDIASNKRLTNELLTNVGIPVPRGGTVDTADEAVAVAKQIGYPVVIKPLDGNHGRGVCIDLRSADDIYEQFDRAYSQSRSGRVMVENFIRGRDHRILVIGGRLIACAERVPAHVVGDGEHTVQQLVDITNSDPRRGIGHEKVLTRISIDGSTMSLLEKEGMDLESVPEVGQFVQLKLTGNMSTGGISIDRTDEIHPDNIEIAEQAAQVIGLDIAGIDMIVEDISLPVKDQAGAICEVNAGPGFRMHTHPTVGHTRDVARPVIDLLFPSGSPSRIPIVAVTGTNGKTTTCRMIAHIIKMAGKRVGLTTTDGIYIDGTQILKGDMSGPQSARMVLQNPTVEHAVLETARGGILRSGLGFDRCDISVVTNITGDHLGKGGVNTIRDLARIKAVVPAATSADGFSILNADDRLCMAMTRRARGELVLFSADEFNEQLREHRRSRGMAVFLRKSSSGEMIVIAEGRRETVLLDVAHIPATFQGRARVNVLNALAAVAATYASDIGVETIRNGLRTFSTSYYQAPGRLNLIEVKNSRVIIDYCHNVAGMEELVDFAERLSATRSVVVIGMAGDRRNEDMVTFAGLAARTFDEFIVREDHNLRRRPPGEVAHILRQALIDHGVNEEQISIIYDEQQAVNEALERIEQDDLVVLLADDIEAVWKTVMDRSSLPEMATVG